MTSHRRQQLCILVGLLALSFNLRPAGVSVGPVLSDMRAALSMSATVAGVVTTLPVLCFAGFGALSPKAAHRFGVHRVMLASLALAALALWGRSYASNSSLFIAATLPALAGMATANVLLPSLVKQHFPRRLGLITSLYSTALAVGMTCAAALTVPVADATGSWRGGLAVWAVTAAVAVLPWLGLLRHDVKPNARSGAVITFRQTATSPLAWWMALFFGIQSTQAYAIFGWSAEIYRSVGFSAQSAGLLLAVTSAVGIPVSLVLPAVAVRRSSQALIVVGLSLCYLIGYAGLIFWPRSGALVCAVALGLGTGIYPLILTLIGLRARTSGGVAALSGFTQSVGYLGGAVGPFMMGAVYDVSGSWTLPLVLLMLLVIPLLVAGLLVSRPRYLEGDLRSSDLVDEPVAPR